MGHTVQAAQLATLAVGSLRNTRRSHAGIVAQARTANEAVTTFAPEEAFVTALLLRVDLTDGTVAAVNAGHPAPYLVRGGEVRDLALEADLPFGMHETGDDREQALALQPGDRVALFTDGMLERNARSIDVLTALRDMAALHPREVVHAFARAVIRATGGHLQDDATVLCVDWYGRQPGGAGRVARAGASQDRASTAPRPAAV